MDFPGFHLDGGAIVALLSLVNTALLVWNARTVQATHGLVNGMQKAAVAEAVQAGVAAGVAIAPAVTPPGGT